MLTDELGDEAAARRLGDERLQERERRVAAAARRADGLLDDVEAAVENSRSGEAFELRGGIAAGAHAKAGHQEHGARAREDVSAPEDAHGRVRSHLQR